MSSHSTNQTAAHRRFATTRWSLVVAAGGDDSEESRVALETLCETYWYPLYAFVRRQGRDPQTAQDLTQGFFTRLLEKEDLKDVRRERGRFRSFLLAAMKNFLINDWDKQQAVKRGGGQRALSLDFDSAENRYRLEPADTQTAEHVFQRQWALTLLDRVQQRLADEARESGRNDQFAVLRRYLTGTAETTYAEAAAELGTTEGAVKTAVHRLRGRFRTLLREEISQTVAEEGEIDDEIRSLFEALRG